jgi:hypothetical protein
MNDFKNENTHDVNEPAAYAINSKRATNYFSINSKKFLSLTVLLLRIEIKQETQRTIIVL